MTLFKQVLFIVNKSDSPKTSSDSTSGDEGYYGSYNDPLIFDPRTTHQFPAAAGQSAYSSFFLPEYIDMSNYEHVEGVDFLLKPQDDLQEQSVAIDNQINSFESNNYLHDYYCSIIYNFYQSIWSSEYNSEEHNNNSSLQIIDEYQKFEDFFDIQTYLYEIDMNLEYFKNDCEEFNDESVEFSIEKMLSFHFSADACNILLHEKEVTQKLDIAFFNSKNRMQFEEIYTYVDEFCSNDTQIDDNECFNSSYLNVLENALISDLDDESSNISDYYKLKSDDSHNATSTSCDIFENVYNYIPKEDNTDESLNKNHFLSQIYQNKRSKNSDSISSSSESSSINGLNNLISGSNFVIPRLAKCAKDMFRKPCVYMLNEGRCMRSDCRFAHDLHNITCKYWLEGECLKGDCCEFLHDFPKIGSESSLNNTSESSCSISKVNQDCALNDAVIDDGFSLNTSDFPELGGNIRCGKQSITLNNNDVKVNNNNSKCESFNENLHDLQSDKLNEENNSEESMKPILSMSKKSRKFKDNVLYSLSIPALAISNRKKNIN
jgi:hypothetical protein